MTNEEAIEILQMVKTETFYRYPKMNEALKLAISSLEKQIHITSDTENIREALMRLSMCSRKECEICKYKDRPKNLLPSDDCKERSTKNMNLLADILLRDKE